MLSVRARGFVTFLRPSPPSGEEHGLLSRIAAGDRACLKQAGDFKAIIFSRYIWFQLSDMYQCKQARCNYA